MRIFSIIIIIMIHVLVSCNSEGNTLNNNEMEITKENEINISNEVNEIEVNNTKELSDFV